MFLSSTDTDEATAAFDDTSTDPFAILGLDVPTADPKVIKRAYKRRALKFHPDVATTQESTPTQKKAASDRFAKINWAYQTLSGKREAGDKTYGGRSTASTGSGSGTSTGGWNPPHRRSSGYASGDSSPSSSAWPGSTDWRDFMPKYEDDEKYDTGGDSFGKIFSDLFAGAAYGAAGVAGSSAGILMDFIDFLEGNVDGYGGSSSSVGGGFSSRGSDDYDAELQVLLRTGSLDDVANEMDDTNLVVEQLQSKARSIEDEVLSTNAEAKMASKYMEKIELEERVAELQARKTVVDGYLRKSRKRLLSLQTRYKELISTGTANDSYAGGGRRSSNPGSTSTSSPSSSDNTASSRSRSSSVGGDEKEAWKTEGFGSSSSQRGSRGSARRRARRSTASSTETSSSTRATSAPTPSPAASTPPKSESPYSSSSYSRESFRPPPPSSTPSSAIRNTTPNNNSNVPPHRRTSTNYETSAEENKRRMREIQVDEEFEKLKKELGL